MTSGGGHMLNREFLLSGRLGEEIRRWSPDMKVLTDAERSASLYATLAERPEAGQGVWVFAYGSLIWNPMIHYTGRAAAHTPDWHRSFCLSTKGGRGTPDNPGLMLGLRPGGGCTGVAFRIQEALVEPELDLLWRREMVARGYIPRWVPMASPDGTPIGHGLAFTIDPEGPGYCDLCEEDVVRRLATARGRMGTAAEYLFRTRDGLRDLDIHCPFVERLATLVDAEIAAATP
jgi:cation transport protein ChaC